MKVQMTAELSELVSLWGFEKACELARIDPYKVSLVPLNEVFIITEQDLKRVGLIEKE